MTMMILIIELENFGPEFTLIPFGSCDQIFYNKNMTLDDIDLIEYNKWTNEFLHSWEYEHDYPVASHSWEKVAIDEMINARIRMAIFAYEVAEQSDNPNQALLYYNHSYNFYKERYFILK